MSEGEAEGKRREAAALGKERMQLERKAKKMQGEADKKVCARCLVLCAVAPFCPSSPPPHACVTLHPAPLPHPPPTYPQSPALIKAREEVARLTRKVRGEERELVIRRTRAEEQAAKVAGLEVQRQQVSAAPLPHFFLSSLACSHVRARLCMHPPHARSPAHAHLYPPTLPPPPHTQTRTFSPAHAHPHPPTHTPSPNTRTRTHAHQLEEAQGDLAAEQAAGAARGGGRLQLAPELVEEYQRIQQVGGGGWAGGSMGGAGE